MATLHYFWNNQSLVFELKDATTIGRADINDLHIPSTALSRQHAIITRIGNDFVITDLGSSNGIEIDGKTVQRATLTDRLSFVMGDVQFSFFVDNNGSAPATPPVIQDRSGTAS